MKHSLSFGTDMFIVSLKGMEKKLYSGHEDRRMGLWEFPGTRCQCEYCNEQAAFDGIDSDDDA